MATLNAISANAISAIAFFIHVSSVVSIDLGAPIVGCSAVGCPPLETNASLPNCRVANYSNSSMIGVAALKSSISSDLTWTQAVSITPNVNYNSDPALPPGNSYSWDFFFGAPKELNLANRTDIGACAFIFTNISRQAVFPGVTSNRTVTGTCSDAFTQECVNAITTRSLTVMDDAIGSGYTGSSPICDLLAAEWSGTVPGPCPSYLGGVTTIRFRGPNAPLPITAAQNKTSNCWPTLPKSNTLSRIPKSLMGQFPATPSLGEDTGPSITTILTVFYPITSVNGTIPLGNILQQPEAHLTCLKPIDEAGAIDTFTAMAGNSKSGGSKMRGAGEIGLLVPGLVVLFWFLGL